MASLGRAPVDEVKLKAAAVAVGAGACDSWSVISCRVASVGWRGGNAEPGKKQVRITQGDAPESLSVSLRESWFF